MNTPYSPAASEPERYRAWQEAAAFEPRGDGEPWCAIMPPPNITGSLHLGHAYEHALTDAFARKARMEGRRALWQPGLDHAGIATQTLLERQLRAEGTSARELGRAAFLARAWAWKESCADTIAAQLRRFGASPQWSDTRFTLDEGAQRATQTLFKRLWDDGLIYREAREHWHCPGCASGLSSWELTDDQRCQRCASPCTLSSTPQWYLRLSHLAPLAQAALDSGALTLEPSTQRKSYEGWLEGLHDWCLSRQMWWGHPIPIWYDEAGKPHALGPDEEPEPGWTQDPDTLDTWFSSALWPLTSLGWPEPTEKLGLYYPTTLLITGYDLMFFWALRMIMLCTYASGTPPFKTLYFHGMLRDAKGKKLSKSFGNAIDPMEWMGEKGADALRLALLHSSHTDRDLPLGADDLQAGWAFCLKLRSIHALYHSRQALPPEGGMAAEEEPGEEAGILDAYLLAELSLAEQEWHRGFEAFELGRALTALMEFAEHALSARYLEAQKCTLGATTPAGARARHTLKTALSRLDALLHPFMPFLSEELWQGLDPKRAGQCLAYEPLPALPPGELESLRAGEELFELLGALRRYRGQLGLDPRALLEGKAATALPKTLARLGYLTAPSGHPLLELQAGRLWLAPPSGSALLRLARQREELLDRIEQLEARLSSPGFLTKAPAALQERTRQQRTQLRSELDALEELLR